MTEVRNLAGLQVDLSNTDYRKVYKDGSAIRDDDVLWRRIHPLLWVSDQNRGGPRPASGAFQDSKEHRTAMSVLLAAMCSSVDNALVGHEDEGLVAFTADFVRRLEAGPQGVDHTPDEGDGGWDERHGSVWGRKTGRVKDALATDRANVSILRTPNVGPA